jgi:hypothetical protein
MIRKYLDKNLTLKQKEFINFYSDVTTRMLEALDKSIISNEFAISLPYWSKQNPVLVKDFTWLMHRLNYGHTQARRNFARFEFNRGLLDEGDILVYRTKHKLDKYLMTYDDQEYVDTLVKRNGKVKKDGIPRPGFNKATKREFRLDVAMLTKYRRPIIQNVIKSIKKGIELGHIKDEFFNDHASYLQLANYVVDHYIANPNAIYNSEFNVQDQRGRAIYDILKRIGNYITSKDFRAMLVVPRADAIILRKDSTEALNDIYYFIAELTGHKCLKGTENQKITAGRQAYLNKELPKLDLKSTEGRDDLHELIWLERIYKRLDVLFNSKIISEVVWDIPLEIDHSMSLAQIVGALTNDERVLESTNVIGTQLSDPWYIEGVRRLAAKAIGTPTFYGSSQSAISLLKSKNLLAVQALGENPSKQAIDIAKKQDKYELSLIKKEFSQGRFSVLKQFKDLLIQNYNVEKPVIDIDTGFSQFKVEVNKFKVAGHETVVTESWDGKRFKYSFTKDPTYVPDYKAMKTFWATCLVHHMDSDLLEHNLTAHPEYWALGIHDAIICLPGQASEFRKTAAKRLKYYNTNRETIMNKYMESIGATTNKAIMQYIKLRNTVKQAEDVEFNKELMK